MKKFYRIFRTALHALRRNISRSVLTCLGIIIGIAAVIAMMEIGQGSSYAIQKSIASMGANVVQIDPSDMVKAGISMGNGARVTLTPDDCDAMLRECSAARWAAPSVDCHVQLIYGGRNWRPRNVLGTTPAFLLVRDWANLAQGASFTDDDVRRAACVCLIGQTTATALFDNEPAVGKEIRANNVRMTVVGVLSRKGTNMAGMDQDDYVIAPWTTIKYRVSGVRQLANAPSAAATSGGVNTLSDLYPTQQPQLYPQESSIQLADEPQMTRFADLNDVWVSATSSQDVQLLIRQITALIRERHRIPDRAAMLSMPGNIRR